MSKVTSYAAIHYEVFGKVQGVFFRKHTISRAVGLGLVGWVRNTERGTVEGVAQGDEKKITLFEEFLKTGSPQSRVEKVVIASRAAVSTLEFESFEKRR